MTLRTLVRDTVFKLYKQVRAPSEMQQYFSRANGSARLNLGCGGNRAPGWLNVDLFPPPGATFMDASRTWPFPDATFEAILCEHMVEHVSRDLARHALKEAYRVLKPGGHIRLVTPDFAFFARLALGERSEETQTYLAFLERFNNRSGITPCEAANLIFYEHGHRFIFTVEELDAMIVEAGFVDSKIGRAADAIEKVFDGVEGHPRVVGAEIDRIEAFAIEAKKPALQ